MRGWNRAAGLLLCLFVCLVIVLVAVSDRTWWFLTPAELRRLNEHRALALAYMENEDYGQALAHLDAIRRARPLLAFAHANRALCLLHLNRPTEALAAARKAVNLRPRCAPAYLVLGQAYDVPRRGRRATEALRQAVRLEPRNPRLLGALLARLDLTADSFEEQYRLTRTLARLAPGSFAAQIRWMRTQVQWGENPGALRTLNRIERLSPGMSPDAREYLEAARDQLSGRVPFTPQGTVVLGNILKGDPNYIPSSRPIFGSPADPADLALREWDVSPPAMQPPVQHPIPVRWTDVTAAVGFSSVRVSGLAPVAAGDVDPQPGTARWTYDRVPRLGAPDTLVGASPRALLRTRSGRFAGRIENPGTGSPLLADLDGDWLLDLFVAAPGGDRLWKNPAQKRETPQGDCVLEPAGNRPWRLARCPGRGPGVPLALDVDGDGDLDLLRPSALPGEPAVRYLRNEGHLRFKDRTRESGFYFPSQGARQVAFADWDGDGDPDLFIVQSSGPCHLFINYGLETFRDRSAAWHVPRTPGARSASVADWDRDGRWDLAVAGHSPLGAALYRNTGTRLVRAALPLFPRSGWDWVEFLDYDNDTWLDLALAGPEGIRLLRNDSGHYVDTGRLLTGACTWLYALNYDADGDLDLLAAGEDGRLRLLRNDGGNRNAWLKVELQGLDLSDMGDDTACGHGVAITVSTGTDTQRLLVTEPQTHVGLGSSGRALYVRAEWRRTGPYNAIGPRSNQTIKMNVPVSW